MGASNDTGSVVDLLERFGDRLRVASEQARGDRTATRAEQLRDRIRTASVAKFERGNEEFLARLRSAPSGDAA